MRHSHGHGHGHRLRRALAATAAILAIATLARAEPPTPTAAACPTDFSLDHTREQDIRSAIRTHGDAAALLEQSEHHRPLAFCFGPIDRSVVRDDDSVLLLDHRLPHAALTARVIHLLHHVVSFPDLDAPTGPPCADVVATALDAEARALADEIHHRAHAHLAPLYEIEPACARESIAACTLRARAYLNAHPDGGPGIDPLALQYAERCARARGDARRQARR